MVAVAVQNTPPRQRIIDAAVSCFARRGFHGASMQEICAEAGMSPGALYRYFPSKTSIIVAIADAEREQHAAFFDRLADAEDPVEALASIGIDALDAYLAKPQAALAAETVAEAIRNPEIRDTFRRNCDEAKASIVGALRRGQATGTVDPELDPAAAAQLVIALGDGLAAHQGLDPSVSTAALRPALETLLRRFLRPAGMALLLLLGRPALAVEEPLPQAVTVVPAGFGTIVQRIGLTGTLVPREEVMVSPRIGDLAVIEIDAEEGDRVAAGQVLARLARDQLDTAMAQNDATNARAQASIAQARAGVVEAEATQTQADLALTRTRSLAGSGNAPRETLELRQAGADTAAARLVAAQNLLRAAVADFAMAQAQRRELDVRVDHTEIRAPVAGVVSRRTARLGAVVQSAADPLFRIIENGTVELEADVPETLLARLRPGQPAEVETASGPRIGRVRLVSPEVNRTSRLGRVRVAVDGEGALVIGSFARASVEAARHEGVLAPLSAILFEPGGPVVQVVHDGMVETRRVTVGLRAEGKAEITEGLKQGEEMVAVSGTFIRDGDRVAAMPPS